MRSGFLTGVLQNHSRKYNFAIDHLSFLFRVMHQYRDQADISIATKTLVFGEKLELDKHLHSSVDGVFVHGLFMDGFRWSDTDSCVEDSNSGEMTSMLPVVSKQYVYLTKRLEPIYERFLIHFIPA